MTPQCQQAMISYNAVTSFDNNTTKKSRSKKLKDDIVD